MIKGIQRNSKGFTLVEVIVVVVLVGILAAVAIPTYLGYQNDARQNAVDQLAQTAAAAADGYFRKIGSDPALADLNLFYDATKYKVEILTPDIKVTMIGHTNNTKSVPFK